MPFLSPIRNSNYTQPIEIAVHCCGDQKRYWAGFVGRGASSRMTVFDLAEPKRGMHSWISHSDERPSLVLQGTMITSPCRHVSSPGQASLRIRKRLAVWFSGMPREGPLARRNTPNPCFFSPHQVEAMMVRRREARPAPCRFGLPRARCSRWFESAEHWCCVGLAWCTPPGLAGLKPGESGGGSGPPSSLSSLLRREREEGDLVDARQWKQCRPGGRNTPFGE